MSGSDPTAIPVAVQGFTWAAAGSWSVFVAVIGGIALALKNIGPMTTKLAELIINRGDRIRAEEREEEVTDKATIVALSERMNRMSGAFAFLANAVTVAINGLASEEGHMRDATAQQARELVAMAVSTLGNEDPYVKALDRVASIPPVDRNRGK